MKGLRSNPMRGAALESALQVVLLVLVLGQVVFLASRHRVRLDLTEESYYTLTESTRRVLAGLDDRLLIEAYFSPDSELAAAYGEAREVLRNVLDEYVQNGRGRVVVQYLDPHSDNDIRERATRLGIKPQTVGQQGDRTLSYKEVWQGVRLRYGGKKQKVIEVLQMQLAPFMHEMVLTPAIKALTVEEKPKIAMIGWTLPPPGGEGAHPGFQQLRDAPQIKDRYAITNLPLTQGELIPDDIETVMLARPKELTDRQKYVIDQFLMRGGKLVVFADTADYAIDYNRTFNRRPVAYDAPDSDIKFLEQLESYGVKVGTNVVLDAHQQAREPFTRLVVSGFMQMQSPVYYPYWFHPIAVDWAEHAETFAKGPDGNLDEALAAQYAEVFEPGVDPELGKGIGAPGMFWPCAVELAETLPEGVEGHVLLRTSPLALDEDPPQTLSPFGRAQDPRQQQIAYQNYFNAIQGRLNTEPRRQFGLMVTVDGTFKSFFAGKEIPLSEAEKKKAEAEKAEESTDPLDEPVGDEAEEPADPIGPAPPEGMEPEAPSGPEPLVASTEPGRVVVIGDSDFIRDDLLTGQYARTGGPYSQTGAVFFLNLLDWLAEDQDLFELRNKATADRTIRLLDEDTQQGTNLIEFNERLRAKESTVRFVNIVVPPLLLLVFGLVVFIMRTTAKRSFLESLES